MELLSTDEDVQTSFSLETLLEMLEKVGYRGNPYKADMKSKVQVQVSITPLRFSNLQNARDFKFLPEVYPNKRQSLPKFQNGQLSGPCLQNGLSFIPYTHISSQDLQVLDT